MHPLASPKAVRPVGDVMLYAVSRDLLMDFVQDPKQHWSFSKPTECGSPRGVAAGGHSQPP